MIGLDACPTRLPGLPMVVHLRPVREQKPNEDVIRNLETMLEDARAGELRSIAFGLSHTRGWMGRCYVVESVGAAIEVLGELEVARFKIAGWIMENER